MFRHAVWTVVRRNLSFKRFININGTSHWYQREVRFSSSDVSPSGRFQYEDENIPMPYGFVAARMWGDRSKSPILVMHGWKDNLASFDRLIPLLLPSLQNQYYFIAVDLPGHGFSSHFPAGMTYQVPDILLLIARLFRHFNWTEPISYMGHSLGGILGFLYASTNPGAISKLITIDALTPILFTGDEILSMVPHALADSLKFEDKLAKNKPPLYSYEETLLRTLHSRVGGLDEASCKVLLSRGICEAKPGSGQFHFTHDIRVQYLPIMTLTTKQIKRLAENFQSELLYIIAKDGVHYERPTIRKHVIGWMKSNPTANPDRDLRMVHLDGHHHLHLMSPEIVAPHIIKFLSRQNTLQETPES